MSLRFASIAVSALLVAGFTAPVAGASEGDQDEHQDEHQDDHQDEHNDTTSPDETVYPSGTSDSPSEPGSLYNVVDQIGARSLWERGTTGAGIDVAVIDTGIAPVPALDDPDKVAALVDLSFEGDDPELMFLDTYGHGTHIAGIIAGSDSGDPAEAADNPEEFYGVAPGARLVSVKVADNSGAVDVSQVIAAIDWVIENRDEGDLDIRVLNLSYGTDGMQDYQIDPLAFAVERAWQAGIVVVTAAGNDGETRTGLNNPATDPFIITVGASDATTGDEMVVPAWSSIAAEGERSPDLVAPGASIESLRFPGSRVAAEHPEGYVSETIMRGSGSSQSSAVVAGAVALLLEERPDLTPDEVKALLTSTAHSFDDVDEAQQGAGLIDVLAAADESVEDAEQSWDESDGSGSLEAARGSAHVTLDGVELVGEQTVWDLSDELGAAVVRDGSTWSGWTWSGWTWSGWTWSGWTWSGWTWSGWTWSGWTWSGWTWSGWTWSGWTWSGWTWS